MKDGCGRKIDYLRISLTDKCNLRCRYCMPEEGIKHLSHDDVLSFEEVRRIVMIMTQLGIQKVRLTGGEPLVRRGMTDLVRMIPCDVYMTTNGCLLEENVRRLVDAGLKGVNISLDTTSAEIFRAITGVDGLDRTLAGIDASIKAGLHVKLNCVPIRSVNESEIESLAMFAMKKGVDIRFIELMPIGCASAFEGIPADEILSRLEKAFGKAVKLSDQCGAPATYYRFPNHYNRIGLISPMSHRFCDTCNRVRLTAEGFLKLCLQHDAGIDLRAYLRQGATDAVIKQAITDAILQKPKAHSFGTESGAEKRKMIQIGG